jgi:uncharacterized protein (TIGR03663 family)
MNQHRREPPAALSRELGEDSPMPRLTVEVALWILIGITALALRLGRLDAGPLSSGESREALSAWRAATGQGMPQAHYSPALLTLNLILFHIFGASDVLARFWPALCGSALSLTPLFLRRYIGRVGMLMTGLCLALSPTLLYASRQLEGTIVAALAWMVFLGGLASFLDSGKRWWLTASAGALGLLVTTGPTAYGLMLPLGLGWLSLARTWPDRGIHWLAGRLGSYPLHMLIASVLVGLMFATAFWWNPAGLGAAGDLLSEWAARFGPISASTIAPSTLLMMYELAISLLGLGGLAWSIRIRNRFGILMGVWASLAFVLLHVMPGRTELDIVWVLLPLTLLAGLALEYLIGSLQREGDWLSEGLHVPVVILLWCHLYLVLGRYAAYGNVADLALATLTIALQGLLTVIFALAARVGAALRALATGTGIVLLVVEISFGWGVAHLRPSDPRELLVGEATAIEVRDLIETLSNLSWRRTGLPFTLPFVLETPSDPVLAWYLRDYTAARQVEVSRVEDSEIPPAVLVSVHSTNSLESERTLDRGEDYVGQAFALSRSWDMKEIKCTQGWPPDCRSAIKWWLFRDSPTFPVVRQEAILWLLQEEGTSHSHYGGIP